MAEEKYPVNLPFSAENVEFLGVLLPTYFLSCIFCAIYYDSLGSFPWVIYTSFDMGKNLKKKNRVILKKLFYVFCT